LISSLEQDRANELAVDITTGVKAAHPRGALDQPDDIAKAAVFLASDDASWITGHPLVVDGGHIAK
jgi:NAD(P)-dependent dehydrogenase (short-subunit alcohol dehydrogenase family)